MIGHAEKYSNVRRLTMMPIKIPYSKPRKTHGTKVRIITKKSISKKIYRHLYIITIF